MPLARLLVPLCLLCATPSAGRSRPVPAIASVQVSKTNLAGGNSLLVTITLTGQAVLGGSAVVVTYSAESVLSNPQKGITIPAGQSSGSFALATVPTATPVAVNVTGSLGASSASATVTVRPPEVQAATVPGSVQGGNGVALSVTLDGPAPSGGSLLHLSFTPNVVGLLAGSVPSGSVFYDPSDLSFPGAGTGCTISLAVTGSCTQTMTIQDSTNVLLVAQGSAFKSIGLLVPAVRDDRPVTGAVSLGNSRSFSLTIRRPRPTNASFVSSCSATAADLTTIAGPATVQFRVSTHDRVAKSGAYVNLSSRSANVVLPATLELDQGGSGTFYACLPATLPAVTQSTAVTFVAAAGGLTNAGSITNIPLAVSSVVLSKDSVSSGTTVTATINMSAVATGDATVQLLSSNATVAPLPSSVTVVQGGGAVTVSFVARVPLTSVSPVLKAIISATYLGSTRADTLIVAR